MDEGRQQIAAEIAARIGEPGARARDFLETADALVGPLAAGIPKSAELAAYALREALTSITAGTGVPDGQLWTAARDVLVAADPVSAAADDPMAIAGLLDSIDRLRKVLESPTLHEARIIRLIERRTGQEPLRLDPDPVAEYRHLVRAANGGLHDSAGDIKTLVDQAFALLGRLFASPDIALTELDRFVTISNPTAEDAAELASRLVSAAHLRYFTERAAAPEWLEALRGSPWALPNQRWPGWPVGDLALRVADADPALAASWLEETVEECCPLDPNSAFNFARTAAGMGRVAAGVLVKLLGQAPQDLSVGAFAHQVLESVDADDAVVDDLADALLNDLSDDWRTGQVVATLAAGTTAANCERRLRLLGYKLRRQARIDPGDLGAALYSVGSLADAVVHEDLLDGVERLIAGAAMVARNGTAAGAGDAAVRGAGELPSPVREQMRAWLLGAARRGSTADAIAAVAEDIATTDATTDHVGVVDRAWAEDPDAAAAAWVRALGTPPLPEALEKWLVDETRRATLWRVRTWCAALPQSVTMPWRSAAEAVAGHPVPGREALAPAEGPLAMIGHSPISVEDLAALDIDTAADRIAAWRPGPDDWLVSARELGRALTEVVKQNPELWADGLPGILERLRHPTYIGHLLEGFREQAGAIVGFLDALADATQLIASEPWEIEVLGGPGDFDKTWGPARTAALSLLETLAVAQSDVAKERPDVFAMVLQRVHDRSDRSVLDSNRDPMLVAINRPSMKALQTAIILGWRSVRAGGPVPPGFVEILDEVLALDGADGLQVRAILARNLDILREATPDWMISRHDLLFGDAAPSTLGQSTVELALNRRVSLWMLEELREQVFKGATRGIRNGYKYVLVAMVNGVDGYSVDEVADWLVTRDAAWISDVVSTLGRLLGKEKRPEVLARGVELVGVLVARNVPPKAMAGLGRWYGVNGLDDSCWKTLMLDAVRRGSVLRDAGMVAERAARSATTDSFLLLETLLVTAIDAWAPDQIAAAALQALQVQTEQSAGREKLRVTLLERGYFAARGL